jgi:hypothetical protein
MTTITRYRRRTSLAISLIAALALAVPVQRARADSTAIVPPTSIYDGNTYGGWSALWWQYVLSQPVSSNPLLDKTGASCGMGQSGPVFFLVGTAGSGKATRNQCTVPVNKALFFPLANGVDVHTPGDGLNSPTKVWDDLEITNGFSISSTYASIDGVPVGNLDPANTPYRACAGPVSQCSARWFSVTLPNDNLFGLTAGTYTPAVADGVYLLLPPLTPGRHTITFGGTGYLSGTFSQDTTYNLTVQSP